MLRVLADNARASANRLLAEANVNPDTRVRDLTDDEVRRITAAIENDHQLVEGDLRREVAMNIKRLQEIGFLSHSKLTFPYTGSFL